MRVEKILTQKELTIDLSIPAMERILQALRPARDWAGRLDVQIEVSNFENSLLNLIERGVDKVPDVVDNTDLI